MAKIDTSKLALPQKREILKKEPALEDLMEEKIKAIHKKPKEKKIRLTVDVSPELYKKIKIKVLDSENPSTVIKYFVALAEADLKD